MQESDQTGTWVVARHPARGAKVWIALVTVFIAAVVIVRSRSATDQRAAPTGPGASQRRAASNTAGFQHGVTTRSEGADTSVGAAPGSYSVSTSIVSTTSEGDATTTTMDPRIQRIAQDLVVDTKLAADVIKVGEPVHLTVTVTKRSSRQYEVLGACGAAAAVELAQRQHFNDPFWPKGSLPGIPGPNFSTVSGSLKDYLRYGETYEPGTVLADRVSTSV